MSINPNENSILTPQRPVPDARLGCTSAGRRISDNLKPEHREAELARQIRFVLSFLLAVSLTLKWVLAVESN